MQIFFHIKLAIRSLRYNLKPAVLLCLSVTTGLVAFMMISGYFTYERGFDRHFPERENIFRIITDIYSEGELKLCILVLLVISSMNLFSMAWHVTMARTK